MSVVTTLRRDNYREKRADQVVALPGSFLEFARHEFRGDTTTHWQMGDIRHQVLRTTADKDISVCCAIFRSLLRFMGDQADYRSNLMSTYQPNLGPVMSRLYSRLGVSAAQSDFLRERFKLSSPKAAEDQTSGNRYVSGESGPGMTTLKRSKKKGGTLGRMKSTLTARLFNKDRSKTIFNSLPLEETLMTPLEQVHFIVGCGLIKPSLRDEVFCQLCKQLSDNPYKTSVSKGWLLLHLVCSSFTPSKKLMDILVHFLGEGPPFWGVQCKKALQRTLQNGVRCQPPALVELECGLQKTPLTLAVTLMDGSQHSLTVDPATTAKELMVNLTQTIGLKEMFGFSLFISMQDKVASLGNGSALVFDAISQCEQLHLQRENREDGAPWRLFLRKELFSPWESSVLDQVATDLVYAQVVRGVMLEEYICEQEHQLATLAAQQYFIEYGAEISDQGLQVILPSYLPPEKLIDADSLEHWSRQIVKAHQKQFDSSSERGIERVKQDVVHFAKTKWPMAFSRYYDVRPLEGADWPSNELCLAVNWTGVYIMNDGDTIYEMSYPEIRQVTDGGSTTGHVVMFFLVQGAKFKFNCKDGTDVRHLIDYMIGGLRKRSTHTIATHKHEGHKAGELTFSAGDLLLLTDPVPDVPDSEQAGHSDLAQSAPGGEDGDEDDVTVSAINERTGDIGSVRLKQVYRLPTLTRPGDDVLNLFQTGK